MAHFPVLIIIIPLMSSFLIPLIGWWKKKFCYPLVLLALFITLILSICILISVMGQKSIHYHLGGWEPPWGIEYAIDYLNAFVAAIVSFISFLAAIYSKRSIEQELPGRVVYFYCLFLLLITGLLGIVVTGDMFNLYVFLEIASLAAYALIAIGEDGALMGSFNYLIMGTIGACFYLLGVGYLYIVTGSLNMADLSHILPGLYHSKVVRTAFALFMVGLAIKVGLFPVHIWVPDAYTHAPSVVSALIASIMSKVSAYVIIRIMFTVFKPYFSIEFIPATTVLSWTAGIAILFGELLAIVQSDLKRMLSYSCVAQIGYIMLGIGLANAMGFIGSLLHILNHAFMKGCLFFVAGAITYKKGMRDIRQFRTLHREMPLTMGAFTIAALSMIGIPPTCGFFSKYYLILGAIDARQWIWVVVLVLSSLLNATFFLRVVGNAYFEVGMIQELPSIYDGGKQEKSSEIPPSMFIPILALTLGILLAGIFSGKIISAILQFAVPANL